MIDHQVYDLINPKERAVDAIPFNVSDWTPIWAIPGQTNMTGHSDLIVRESPINSAKCLFVVENTTSTPCEARCVGLRYNEHNQPVWHRDWGGIVQNTANTVANISQQLKTPLSAYFQSHSYVYAHVEVRGAGKLYQASVEISWLKPDVIDHSPAIADLVTRVTALEMAATSNGGSVADAKLVLKVDSLETKLAKVAAALAG